MKAIPNVSRTRYIAHTPTSRLIKVIYDKFRACKRLQRMRK